MQHFDRDPLARAVVGSEDRRIAAAADRRDDGVPVAQRFPHSLDEILSSHDARRVYRRPRAGGNSCAFKVSTFCSDSWDRTIFHTPPRFCNNAE